MKVYSAYEIFEKIKDVDGFFGWINGIDNHYNGYGFSAALTDEYCAYTWMRDMFDFGGINGSR